MVNNCKTSFKQY